MSPSRSAFNPTCPDSADPEEGQGASPADDGPNYVDVDKLHNSDRIVAVFSQRRWDGGLTFSIHREFDKKTTTGALVRSKTSFVPESLGESYVAHATLAVAHLEKLKAKRAAGKLPFPEGGVTPERRR